MGERTKDFLALPCTTNVEGDFPESRAAAAGSHPVDTVALTYLTEILLKLGPSSGTGDPQQQQWSDNERTRDAK